MSHTLAPLMATILNDLPEAFECTLRHEAAVQVLVMQCASITAHIDAAKARIAKEKAAQRLLRAEIAAFLRERGELRSANSSRVMEDSLLLSNASKKSAAASPSGSILGGMSNSSLYQESPLCLKSKRKGRIFDADIDILPKRRRLTVETDEIKPSPSELQLIPQVIKAEDRF
ncbi:hypothetical protein TRAPUB_12390 [Trametes pubescens]|uniref:Uncharacterized protein n=1 Tax=Trametes pubescens TaxID=154538 RepID=A0A1M2VU87_TRAPU|nr:hypothetical protein TRAPUB_12390 [Trametes pubescens]